jgi:hypothetical protein
MARTAFAELLQNEPIRSVSLLIKDHHFFLPANPKNDAKSNTVEARSYAREGVTLDPRLRNSAIASGRDSRCPCGGVYCPKIFNAELF